ncbi:MAG: hypothetical protein HFH09_02615 [Bacilli bacterium]|jgi:hypothetical protein|nr:hypothetical protein [Bacilli bacterium]
MLEFKDNETIEVIDTQAWIESNNEKIEIQLIVTNMRFLAVKETPKGKFVICDFNLEEMERIDHQTQNTTCWLVENRFVKFDSDPIGEYLLKYISNK